MTVQRIVYSRLYYKLNFKSAQGNMCSSGFTAGISCKEGGRVTGRAEYLLGAGTLLAERLLHRRIGLTKGE